MNWAAGCRAVAGRGPAFSKTRIIILINHSKTWVCYSCSNKPLFSECASLPCTSPAPAIFTLQYLWRSFWVLIFWGNYKKKKIPCNWWYLFRVSQSEDIFWTSFSFLQQHLELCILCCFSVFGFPVEFSKPWNQALVLLFIFMPTSMGLAVGEGLRLY